MKQTLIGPLKKLAVKLKARRPSNRDGSRKEHKYQGNVASEYLRRRAHKPDWHEEQLVLGSLLSRLPDQLKVLDIPFGTGRFVPFYAAKNFTCIGVDISAEMLELAKSYNRQDMASFETATGDATRLQFADGAVDLVVSYRFLGYILTVDRAKEALRELARVSASHLILQLQYLKDGEPRGNQDKLGHKVVWSELSEFLKEIGLEIVEKADISSKDQYQNTVILARKMTPS